MTDVSLRDYFEALILDHEKAHAAFAESLRVAGVSLDKRLEGMNEFRQTLTDSQKLSVPRDTFDISMERLNQNRTSIEDRLNAVERSLIGRDIFEQRAEAVNQRLGAIERAYVGREVFQREIELRDEQIDALNGFRARAMGAGAILALISGVVGAAIFKVFS